MSDDNKKQVHLSNFKTSHNVVCGICNGSGKINDDPCNMCGGSGILERQTEGIVKLYQVTDKS
jgi:DnaJ-class molecular chaperone